MKELKERRPARTPLEEGVSSIPYMLIYQRLHRQRWQRALLAGAVVAGLGWLWSRRR